jgi:hypothetical protein
MQIRKMCCDAAAHPMDRSRPVIRSLAAPCRHQTVCERRLVSPGRQALRSAGKDFISGLTTRLK